MRDSNWNNWNSRFDRSDTPWIAGAAALAGIATYILANRARESMIVPTHELMLDRAAEYGRTAVDYGRSNPGRIAAGALTLAVGGWLLSQLASQRQSWNSSSSTVEEVLDVNVPVSTAYNQWTQFEEFPRFMPTVQEVRQIDDQHLHWRAVVAGKTVEWDSEITEQIPDQRIAWRSTTGPKNWGEVTFEKVHDNRTRVRLQMYYEPQTTDEKVGSALGGVKLTAKGNLKRFKQLVERRGMETGAWRGEIGAQTH